MGCASEAAGGKEEEVMAMGDGESVRGCRGRRKLYIK